MRMRKEIFESEVFSKMADTSVLLVNADFPRNKKNQPAESIKKQNEALADKYNMDGRFPFTVLLDVDGTILKSWDGLPAENATKFAEDIKLVCNAHK